ncbi:MAG: type II secretion system F family protein [Candidatus Moranbacteria bacterium]|nr:type II secretion system F family protein [Candidatus Moranbacteria bacterium]
MPTFEYLAKNQKGKEKKGTIETTTKKVAAEEIREKGFWPVYIEEVKKRPIRKRLFSGIRGVSLKDKMIFCRHLGVMISSGLSMSRALDILSGQEKKQSFKKIIIALGKDVRKGIALADAMIRHPQAFNKVFTSMVKVGETGGSLEEVLKILSSQLEKDHKLVSKIKGALIYPSIIIIVMIVISILMMMFVIPKITTVFEEFDAELPISTRIVIAISDFMAANVFLTLGIIFVLVGSVVFFYKSEPGKKIFHKLFLKTPIISSLVIKLNSARFARILSSLLVSGVSLVEALKITSDTLENYYFKISVEKASEDVQKGMALTDILSKNETPFPFLVIKMLKVGEDTGKTPDILERLADFYEEEVDQITQNLAAVIEPVLMVVVGIAVAFFAIAIIKPIYSLMQLV